MGCFLCGEGRGHGSLSNPVASSVAAASGTARGLWPPPAPLIRVRCGARCGAAWRGAARCGCGRRPGAPYAPPAGLQSLLPAGRPHPAATTATARCPGSAGPGCHPGTWRLGYPSARVNQCPAFRCACCHPCRAAAPRGAAGHTGSLGGRASVDPCCRPGGLWTRAGRGGGGGWGGGICPFRRVHGMGSGTLWSVRDIGRRAQIGGGG